MPIDLLGPFFSGKKLLQSACKTRDESPQSCQPASKLLHSFSGGRSLRFYNDFKLNRIGLNHSLRHHEAQEFTRTDSECTL